jgi:hypothetical protein
MHTKFVEDHQARLRQMLDFLLPAEAIDTEAPSFARRFGLRYDEPQIRMRVLDSSLSQTSGWPSDDVSLSVSALARLHFKACTVVVSENKMTFLTLPRVENALALWGGGFGIELLRDVQWLRACEVYYWGDLDAHGFIILSRLRSFLPEEQAVYLSLSGANLRLEQEHIAQAYVRRCLGRSAKAFCA